MDMLRQGHGMTNGAVAQRWALGSDCGRQVSRASSHVALASSYSLHGGRGVRLCAAGRLPTCLP